MNRTPLLHIVILSAFLANTFGPLPNARAGEVFLPAGQAGLPAGQAGLPTPGARMAMSPAFMPPMLFGLTVDPADPLKFNFLIDQGDVGAGHARPVQDEALKEEYIKLIKYFLASLTIPEKDLWVNLSPYEGERIIPSAFGQTEMGRDLLGQDYVLKQITASLIYPEGELGKKFWADVYKKAFEQYGTTNIPVNTFNKVWIVPDEAMVYEHDGSTGSTGSPQGGSPQVASAFVVKSHLKVMLEEDYLALTKNQTPTRPAFGGASPLPSDAGLTTKAPQGNPRDASPNTNTLGSQVVRAIVLPALEKEVNEGKNFAQLRQINNALILATWYKRALKESLLSKFYVDKAKVTGLEYTRSVILSEAKDPKRNDIDGIYQRYLEAFKKGAYNFIKEETDPYTQQTIPRKYFSGGYSLEKDGAMLSARLQVTADRAQVPTDTLDHIRADQVRGNIVDVSVQTDDFQGFIVSDPKRLKPLKDFIPRIRHALVSRRDRLLEIARQRNFTQASLSEVLQLSREITARLYPGRVMPEQFGEKGEDVIMRLVAMEYIKKGTNQVIPQFNGLSRKHKNLFLKFKYTKSEIEHIDKVLLQAQNMADVKKDDMVRYLLFTLTNGSTDGRGFVIGTQWDLSNGLVVVMGQAENLRREISGTEAYQEAENSFLSAVDDFDDRVQHVLRLLSSLEQASAVSLLPRIGVEWMIDPRPQIVDVNGRPWTDAAMTAAKKGTILVVDDPLSGGDVAKQLRDAGYTVVTVVNGEEARGILGTPNSGISLVIGDIDMLGVPLVKKLRGETSGPAVVVTTADSSVPDDIKDMKTIYKPFDDASLLKAVRSSFDAAMTAVKIKGKELRPAQDYANEFMMRLNRILGLLRALDQKTLTADALQEIITQIAWLGFWDQEKGTLNDRGINALRKTTETSLENELEMINALTPVSSIAQLLKDNLGSTGYQDQLRNSIAVAEKRILKVTELLSYVQTAEALSLVPDRSGNLVIDRMRTAQPEGSRAMVTSVIDEPGKVAEVKKFANEVADLLGPVQREIGKLRQNSEVIDLQNLTEINREIDKLSSLLAKRTLESSDGQNALLQTIRGFTVDGRRDIANDCNIISALTFIISQVLLIMSAKSDSLFTRRLSRFRSSKFLFEAEVRMNNLASLLSRIARTTAIPVVDVGNGLWAVYDPPKVVADSPVPVVGDSSAPVEEQAPTTRKARTPRKSVPAYDGPAELRPVRTFAVRLSSQLGLLRDQLVQIERQPRLYPRGINDMRGLCQNMLGLINQGNNRKDSLLKTLVAKIDSDTNESIVRVATKVINDTKTFSGGLTTVQYRKYDKQPVRDLLKTFAGRVDDVRGLLADVQQAESESKVREFVGAFKYTDAAMNASVVAKDLGGINLNPANLNLRIKRDGSTALTTSGSTGLALSKVEGLTTSGKGVPLPLNLQDMGSLNNIEGLIPVIIKIVPATHIPALSALLGEEQGAMVSAAN